MSQTVTGLFDSYADADRAVRELEAAGVAHDRISVVASNAGGEHGGADYAAHDDRADHAREDAGKGAGAGAVVGGAGGLLAGLGLLAIPGLGPVVAAGWLASTAVGALVGGAVGAAAGGLVGALTKEGVPEEDAHVYAEGVRRGGALVTARVEDGEAAAAAPILRGDQAVDLQARRASYAEEGWTGFEPDAPPFTPDEVAAERRRYAPEAAR